ncbi:type VII secretion protein EccB [Actinomadura decatromicini]|uniref:Type VII secretion protein EccB n=1 Tax=Actinomadura decatromicini TaxID=2604572 RepID=A0A5D3F1Y0_9ACTN|nr:type VII secretion protein EccB [Actinomadura decatromicini]TYK43057.1 type VII secretion protein EccB [Actinomadura decatromicini]
MQNKRDQVQSHMCAVGRLNAALVSGDPDVPDAPMKRVTTGAVVGAVLGMLLLAGFGVYGLIRPGGSTDWRTEGALVSVKESGARYVFLGGQLHPVANLASGRLIAGPDAKLVSVHEGTLGNTPRGFPVGILGAPDALPRPASLGGRDWLVCTTALTDPAGRTSDQVVITMNVAAPRSAAAPDEGLLVRASSGQAYLLWRGRRHRFATAAGPFSLGYRGVVPYRVADQWINLLPAGGDVAPPPVPGRGDAGPDIGDRPTRIGQVFTTENPGTAKQYFVLFGDGLRQVSETVAALLLGDPATAGAYGGGAVRAVPLPSAAAARFLSSAPGFSGGLPGTPPPVRQAGGFGRPVCASARAGSDRGASVEVVMPRSGVPAGGVPVTEPGPRTAQVVLVKSGTGALVRSLPAPGSGTGVRYLITDLGVKHPVPGDDDLSALGYARLRPVPVPPALLDLLPSGPALARAAAARPSQTGGS